MQIILPSFITPDAPAGQDRYSIQMPARVIGTVSALYYDRLGQTEWEVWNATLNGSGTARIDFFNYGSEARAFAVSLPYTGTASVTLGTPFIQAPDQTPTGIAYASNSLFVSDIPWSGLANITQIDPKDGTVLRSLLAPSDTGFDGRGNPSDLTYARGHLFVSDVGTPGAGRVYEIAPDATKLYNTYPLPFRGGAIATDGTRLFVGDLDSSSMLVFAGPQQLRRTLLLLALGTTDVKDPPYIPLSVFLCDPLWPPWLKIRHRPQVECIWPGRMHPSRRHRCSSCERGRLRRLFLCSRTHQRSANPS